MWRTLLKNLARMAWAGLPPAAPTATTPAEGQGLQRLRRRSSLEERNHEGRLFFDARLPPHEQAKVILFKYDTDVLYCPDDINSEAAKQQPAAHTDTSPKAGTERNEKDTSSTVVELGKERNNRKRGAGGAKTVYEQAVRGGQLASDTHILREVKSISGPAITKYQATPATQVLRAVQSTQEKATKGEQQIDNTSAGPTDEQAAKREQLSKNTGLVRSSSSAFNRDTGKSRCTAKNSATISGNPPPVVRQLIPTNRRSEGGKPYTAGSSSLVLATSKSSSKEEDRHRRDNSLAVAENVKDNTFVPLAAESSPREEEAEISDGLQHSGRTSQASSTVSSAATIADTKEEPYGHSLRAAVAAFLSFRRCSPQQELLKQERKESKRPAASPKGNDSDEEIGAGLFKDDAAWDRLVTDLQEFQLK